MVNGSPKGFFSISRGLRKGDPLYPLIFVLIEDVLSRNLSKLFARRSMHYMVRKKGIAPSHLLFEYDILIFCRGNLQSLQNLVTILGMYKRASGQCVNFSKSQFYYGGGSKSRAVAISNFLGMRRAYFPDRYLGIQLNPGIVRIIHVLHVVEKIRDKLVGWKGQLLSFQARLVLIKDVISSYIIHSMAVYKWPRMAIKQVEKAIRNFLWSGDAEKRKYFTVRYDSLCCKKSERRAWYQKAVRCQQSNADEDLGIRLVFNFVQKHTRSIIGNGENPSLFFDSWCGDFSIAKKLGISSKGPKDFQAKVCNIIADGIWAISQATRNLMLRCNIYEDNLPIIAGGDDYKIWDLDKKGVFSVKSAKAAINSPTDIHPCAALFSRKVVHPSLGVQRIWVWAAGIFSIQPNEDLVSSYQDAKGRSRMIKDLWLVTNLAIVTELWKTRNKAYFENAPIHWLGFKGRVYQMIRDNSIRMKGHMFNTVEDLRI
ncbi:uncharacterized protein LOC113294363 [Papaver somniferum]|uniref:uncharacterized protein LOC113294363 n=1 Tax=Papaver somniferum TaxID=3469 RepID=UPI000E703740|nr:uncharacterized protein LOC113294363 [Papaver somniferum]